MTFPSPKNILAICATALLATACGGNKEPKTATAILEQARQEYADKQYDKALHSIDSLRKTFPQDIEARKAALKLYQDISLTQAQEDLANTDQRLQQAKAEYDNMKAKADQDRDALRATSEQLQAVTLKKMELDSLQVRFDVQCAKIKYIHKKQKE